MFSKLDTAFRLAAKNYATSLFLWLLSAPFLIGGLAFTEYSDAWQINSILPVLLVGVASHLSLGMTLFLASKTILHPSRRESAGWKEVVATYVAGGTVRGFTIGFLMNHFQIGNANYFMRISTAILLVLFTFTFFAYSAELWRNYRVKRFRILSAIAEGEKADALRSIASSQLRALVLGELEQDVLQVRDQTKQALASIRKEIRSGTVDTLRIQSVMDNSDSNWRRLSHKTWVSAIPDIPKIDLSEIAKTLVSSRPISLVLLSAGPVYGFSRVFHSMQLESRFIAATIWLVGVLFIAHATNQLAAKFQKSGVRILVAGILAIQVVAFVIGQAILGDQSTQTELWYVSLVSSLSAIAFGLPPAIERGGQLVLEQLEQRLDKSAIENLRAQSEMFYLAKRLGVYLHSEVRGDFLRHSLALREALESGDNVAAERIIDRLEHLVGEINLEESERTPFENLEQFLSNWNGVIRVNHNLFSTKIDDQFQPAIAEIVMESVNNAVRHGHATWVKITLSPTSREVVVEVQSNSKAVSNNATAGLGTNVLNRLAPDRWSFRIIESANKELLLILKVVLSAKNMS